MATDSHSNANSPKPKIIIEGTSAANDKNTATSSAEAKEAQTSKQQQTDAEKPQQEDKPKPKVKAKPKAKPKAESSAQAADQASTAEAASEKRSVADAFTSAKEKSTKAISSAKHPHAIIFGILGFLFALLVFTIGIFKSLFLLIMVFVGVAIGQAVDGDPKIINSIRRLFNPDE